MEAIFCLLIFIVASGIWAFLKSKKRATNGQGGLYYFEYAQGYEDDSERQALNASFPFFIWPSGGIVESCNC